MSIADDLARGDPARYVEIAWRGDQVDGVSVRSGWKDEISLAGLLRHIVDEVGARRPVPATEIVQLRVAERGLELSEILALGRLLATYNEAREAAREASVAAAPAVTQYGRIELLWYGDQLAGIRVDPDWALRTPAQSLSDALTRALSEGLRPLPRPSTDLTRARDELVAFLG